ncbi:Copia protein [Eumeta japonica]|uniref:Copia protein n=1 Tax=Eumeta variegata TaxID=151549 RepID=A0A4C1X2C6_EUMVA|nr:Copia protein [Eumeta japonica]
MDKQRRLQRENLRSQGCRSELASEASIDKLRGRENYEDWAFAVENYLILEGLQQCINTGGDPNDAKAKAKIVLTINSSLFVHIKNASTAMGLWQKLTKLFDDNGDTRRIGLLRNLISIRRKNCERMSQYVNSLLKTSQRLNDTGFKISDDGASCHLTSKKYFLLNTTNQHQVREIIIADNTRISVEVRGDVQIFTVVRDTEHENTVMGVLYVPNLATNLLSVCKIISKGNKVTFDEKHCYIYNQKSELEATADLVGGVYKLRIKQVDCLLTSASGSVWHRRLGHLNSKDLNVMRGGAVKGMSFLIKAQVSKTNCICCKGKQARLPFNHVGNRGKELFELVHADVCGPMEARSIEGKKYFL